MDINKDLDLTGAKERFMKNEGMYKRFLFRFPQENRFEELEKKIEAGDAEGAFEVAHTMKGVAGNLSLQSVSEILNPMVEVLRKGEIPEKAQVDELKTACEHILEVIHYIEENDVSLF